jgi:hypothetical protein
MLRMAEQFLEQHAESVEMCQIIDAHEEGR